MSLFQYSLCILRLKLIYSGSRAFGFALPYILPIFFNDNKSPRVFFVTEKAAEAKEMAEKGLAAAKDKCKVS